MLELASSVSSAIADSVVREWTLWLLMNVPGFPPIVQSVHILAVCAVVASAVMLNLRLVGIEHHC